MSVLPSGNAMLKAAEMSIKLDKPICMDYYVSSYEKDCKIAKDGGDGDKFLYKNPEEYTSPLKNMYKISGSSSEISDFILETQNSIYMISGNMLSIGN
tara:strand:- start:18094 stop:18387 length:294 start_codon:yes stop_codon:yes gene_type:complete